MWGASKVWLYSDFLTAKTAYTHFKTSQAIALKFQSALVFRRQHVMGRELLGFLHPSPRVPWCPGVFVSYAAPYHGACIHSRHWLLFRPSLPNSRDMSWYQKTITGIENTTVSAWAAWFCCFSYMEIIFLSCWSLFYTSLETGSCQEVVLMHSSCSGAPWRLRAHWSERQLIFSGTHELTVFGYIFTSVKFNVTEAICKYCPTVLTLLCRRAGLWHVFCF